MITLAKQTPTWACTDNGTLRLSGPVVKVTESDVTFRVDKITGVTTGSPYPAPVGYLHTAPVTECDTYRIQAAWLAEA